MGKVSVDSQLLSMKTNQRFHCYVSCQASRVKYIKYACNVTLSKDLLSLEALEITEVEGFTLDFAITYQRHLDPLTKERRGD